MHPAIRNFTTKAFDIKHYKDFITYAFGDEEGLELMQESYKNPNDNSKYTYTKLKQEYCLLPEPIEWGGGANPRSLCLQSRIYPCQGWTLQRPQRKA